MNKAPITEEWEIVKTWPCSACGKSVPLEEAKRCARCGKAICKDDQPRHEQDCWR